MLVGVPGIPPIRIRAAAARRMHGTGAPPPRGHAPHCGARPHRTRGTFHADTRAIECQHDGDFSPVPFLRAPRADERLTVLHAVATSGRGGEVDTEPSRAEPSRAGCSQLRRAQVRVLRRRPPRQAELGAAERRVDRAAVAHPPDCACVAAALPRSRAHGRARQMTGRTRGTCAQVREGRGAGARMMRVRRRWWGRQERLLSGTRGGADGALS